MSDFEAVEKQIAQWLEPLADEAAPCGPDLEYDNEFLALTQAAAGKPESQFGPAEPPVWRNVVEMAEVLLGRSRDLRIAIFWLRGCLHTQGYGVLPSGLKLLHGLIDTQWAHVHPLPDPDDGDPYARVNALTLLRESEGLIGDLRAAKLIADRNVGMLDVRSVEVALGLSPARADEEAMSQHQVAQMLSAGLAKDPALKTCCADSVVWVRQLMSLINDKLGDELAPDLRPLLSLVNGVLSCLPSGLENEAGDETLVAEEDGAPVDGLAPGPSKRGLSGGVNSREEAIRAIAMVCEYLERVEPANPAPLFLRRGSQLINQNFLQLMKLLAPDALSGVAGLVGIDPYSIDGGEQ